MNFMRGHKIVTGIGVLLLVVVVSFLAFFNSLFEEREAHHVNSIAQLTGAKSVLGVFAHPDDEQLFTGLLIRAADDPEIQTAAVTATKGEAGTPLPQVSRYSDLGAVRKAEALKNTWALGVDHHDVLDFPDGGVADTPIDELKMAVREQMLRHRPDLIATFWPESGFSDHADHKRMGLVAELVTLELQVNPVEGYAGPSHFAYALAPRRMMTRFGGETGSKVIANQPPPNYSQSGEAWAKLRGWKIHASQRNYVQHAYGFPDWFVHRLYDKEHYYVIEANDIPERSQ